MKLSQNNITYSIALTLRGCIKDFVILRCVFRSRVLSRWYGDCMKYTYVLNNVNLHLLKTERFLQCVMLLLLKTIYRKYFYAPTTNKISLLPFLQPQRLIVWWRHQMETISALLALCTGNSPVTGEFPLQRPVTLSFDVFFDLRLKKWLWKQSIPRWFETLSPSLWRHCHGWPRLMCNLWHKTVICVFLIMA